MAMLTEEAFQRIIHGVTSAMTTALTQVMKPNDTKGWIDQKSIGGPPE